MSRINTNIQSLIAQRALRQNNNVLATSLERLSTGLRIVRAADDPAGLIASENLRSEVSGLRAGLNNIERAQTVATIAEGGLTEVSSLLSDLQGLLTTAANVGGLDSEEVTAAQLEVDSILQTIDRISTSTSFQGIKLLNGNFDFVSSNVSASVEDFRVRSANLDNGQALDVEAIITTSAQLAGLFLSVNGTVDLNGGVDSAFQFEIAGSLGSRELAFSSGVTAAQMADAINTYTEVTGVAASVSGTGVKLASSEYGSDAFVSVTTVDAADIQGTGVGIYELEAADFGDATGAAITFGSSQAGNGVRDAGQDLSGTINGQVARGEGKTMSVRTPDLDLELTLGATAAQTLGSVSAFSVLGGGATFQIGARVNAGNLSTIGLYSTSSTKLGNSSIGYLSHLGTGRSLNLIEGNIEAGQKIVTEAIKQVSTLRGSIGAFQRHTLGAAQRSMEITLENTVAAESVIRDADFAVESAALTRSQILSQASTNVLQLANSQPQSVLGLLG